MLPLSDQMKDQIKDQIFLNIGGYLAYSGFSTVYNAAMTQKTLAMTTSLCTNNLFKGIANDEFIGSLSCREHIVKIFGPGISIWSLDGLLQTFKNSDFDLKLKLGLNACIGILGLAMTIVSAVIIGKKIRDNALGQAKASSEGEPAAQKNCSLSIYQKQIAFLGVPIATLSLMDSVKDLVTLFMKRSKATAAINYCCIKALNRSQFYFEPTLPCNNSITALFSPATQVSSLADLCGNGLPTLLEANYSPLLSNAIWITLLVAIPLGAIGKIGIDYYKSLPVAIKGEETKSASPSELEFIRSDIGSDSDDLLLPTHLRVSEKDIRTNTKSDSNLKYDADSESSGEFIEI